MSLKKEVEIGNIIKTVFYYANNLFCRLLYNKNVTVTGYFSLTLIISDTYRYFSNKYATLTICVMKIRTLRATLYIFGNS